MFNNSYLTRKPLIITFNCMNKLTQQLANIKGIQTRPRGRSPLGLLENGVFSVLGLSDSGAIEQLQHQPAEHMGKLTYV